MLKNVASQKIPVYLFSTLTGAALTGDAANISAQISIDGAATAATDDVAPTELDSADAPGVYLFDMTQAETNGDLIILSPASTTADTIFRPVFIYTREPAIMTAQMAESYAADGVAPTPAQALFLIQQVLTQFKIVGTALTIQKLDGSTAAAVLTLDDAVNPTLANRTS